jgi:DinB superfamily
MAHPLVDQLRFTRSEFTRSLKGVTEEEGFQRFGVMNSIGWIVGHVANQEQRYWIRRIGQPPVVEGLEDLVGSGRPASTPSLATMLAAREAIVAAADPYLDSLTETDLGVIHCAISVLSGESTGTLLQRVRIGTISATSAGGAEVRPPPASPAAGPRPRGRPRAPAHPRDPAPAWSAPWDHPPLRARSAACRPREEHRTEPHRPLDGGSD